MPIDAIEYLIEWHELESVLIELKELGYDFKAAAARVNESFEWWENPQLAASWYADELAQESVTIYQDRGFKGAIVAL